MLLHIIDYFRHYADLRCHAAFHFRFSMPFATPPMPLRHVIFILRHLFHFTPLIIFMLSFFAAADAPCRRRH